MADPSFKLFEIALSEVILDVVQQLQVQEAIGLGNVNNTSDVNKPLSTAAIAALANKVAGPAGPVAADSPVLFAGTTGKAIEETTWALFKQFAGLDLVNNTSDVNKPVSIAQAAAIALKAPSNNAVFTGTTTLAADPGAALQAATKQYVDNTVNALLDAANAEQFKGVIDCSGSPDYPAANSGWTYRVSVAGLIGGGAGVAVEVGDRIQCIVDGSVAGNHATVGANWWITQANVLFSSNGLSLVTAANYAAIKTLLVIAAADITDASANGRSLISAANYAAMKVLLAITAADITNASANGRSLITAADYAAMKTLLALNNVDNTSDTAKNAAAVILSNKTLAAPIFTGLVDNQGGQTKYPVVQNPSTDPNTFDDYEEGTWTPDFTFATPGDLAKTLSLQSGSYIKIGKLVTVTFNLQTSAFTYTTAVGDLTMTGLPFTAQNVAGDRWRGTLQFIGITKAGYTNFTVGPLANTTTAVFVASGSAQSAATVTAADMPTGTVKLLQGSFSYMAAT